MRIGIDIDSTLNQAHKMDIINGRKFCHSYRDGYYPIEHLDECSVKKMFEMTEEMYNEYMKIYFPWNCKHTPPEIGASAALIYIRYYLGCEIYIVTARDANYNKSVFTGDMMMKATYDWFRHNYIPYDKIIFSASDKYDACLQYDIDIMIDDDPKHITKLIENKFPTIIHGQSYNELFVGCKAPCYYSTSWYHTKMILDKLV